MKQGDVYVVDLDPTRGREQAGKRHVVVISQKPFNDVTGNPIVAPVTQGGGFAREAGFTVSLSGCGSLTQGVVLCHQLRVLDLKARNGKRIETLPLAIVQEVLDHIIPIFEG